MSSHSTAAKSDRLTLIDELLYAIYANSTTAVFFHSTIAEQIGLGATEEKTLLILSDGSLTAGEIAQHTGLTTAAVTNLLDRLERKGFVTRVRDAHDRRKVIVEANQEKLAELARIFTSLQGIFEDVVDGYTDDQIALVTDFLKRTSQRSREAIDKLRQQSD